jgi:hypothetical protein
MVTGAAAENNPSLAPLASFSISLPGMEYHVGYT